MSAWLSRRASWMSRRDLLKNLGAYGTVALASSQLLASAAGGSRKKAQLIIDVHCHIFNSKDLPSKEFLRTVVFEKYPAQVTPNPLLPGGKKRAWSLSDLIIDSEISGAPSPEIEIRCLSEVLKNSHCEAYDNTFNNTNDDLFSSQRSTSVFDALVNDFNNLVNGKKRTKFFQGDEWAGRQDEVYKILSEALGGKIKLSELSQAKFRTRLSGQLRSNQRNLSYKLQWPNILRKYRFQIFENYKSAYVKRTGSSARRVVLIAPALVDMSCWLKKNCQTGWWPDGQKQQINYLRQQSHLMNLLSQTSKFVRMQGYVAFDPLREIYAIENKLSFTPLMIVKEAVREHGFIGVKLYPPMGFRPTGNSEAGLSFPKFSVGAIENFGAKLDGALGSLYKWCSQNGVAIMAHAYESNAAGAGYGCRASPVFWNLVLKKHPELHLNLAHFGRFDTTINCTDKTAKSSKLSDSWEWEIGRIISQPYGKNIYADLSYFNTVLGGNWDDNIETKRTARHLKKWIARFDPDCRHLMFGTDWSMIALEGDYHSYIENLELFMLDDVGLTRRQLGNFFFNNAVRYFGLSTGRQSRSRLETFYNSSKKLKSGFLRKYDDEIEWG